GAQRDREAEVFQVSNDDTAVAQRWLEDKQHEEKTNTDCLVKVQEKEYQTGWKIKTCNVLDSCNQSLVCPSIKQEMLEPVKVKCIFLGYRKGIVGNKLWRLDDVTSKVVLYRNMGFNESEKYKKTFIGFGVGTGSMQVLQGDEFEVKPQDNHTFEVEPHGNFGHVVGLQEVQTQDLIYYHPTRDREQHSARLKDDMDARSDVYVLSNGCKKCSDDSDGYNWESTPARLPRVCRLKQKEIYFVWRSSGIRVEYQIVYTRLNIASADVGMLDKFDHRLQTDVQSQDSELSLVAGIAIGALVKGGSRSEVPAQVEGAAYRY
ncbi:hypothetical protein Tco_0809508, partial [Tanacetum coccineum]